MNSFTLDIMLSIVFGIIGIILLITGYVVFDKVLKKIILMKKKKKKKHLVNTTYPVIRRIIPIIPNTMLSIMSNVKLFI
ncbi:hypothetical protein [Clostridium butyricum]